MVHLFQFPQHEVIRSIQCYLPPDGMLVHRRTPRNFVRLLSAIACQFPFIPLGRERHYR